MASVQARLMVFFMRKLKSQAQKLVQNQEDIALLRSEKERVFRRFRPPRSVSIKSLDIDELTAAWFTPEKLIHPNKVVLYLHGGGYAAGSVQSYKGLMGKLAHELGIKTLGINYRLAPEHPYPAALDDAMAAYKWLLNQEHFNPEDIIIMGDSAGGGLTLCTLMRIREEKLPQPLAAVMMSPWTDLAVTGESAIKTPEKDPLLITDVAKMWGNWYAGSESILHPFISPLYGSLTDLAPMLVQVGTEEILFNDSTRLEDKIKHANNTSLIIDIWDNMPHVWHMGWNYIPESKRAIAKIVAFVNYHIDQQNKKSNIITPSSLSPQGLTQKTRALAQMSFETVKFGAKIIKNHWK